MKKQTTRILSMVAASLLNAYQDLMLRERMRPAGGSKFKGSSHPREHRHNPAGSKLLRRAMKHKFGDRCTYAEAKKLYKTLPGGATQ